MTVFNAARIAANAEDPAAARAMVAATPLPELLADTAELSSRFFSSETPQSDDDAGTLWVVNQELTMRGIAPKFRAPIQAPKKPMVDLHLPFNQAKRRALLFARLVDLEWLLAQRHGATKNNRVIRKLALEGLGGTYADDLCDADDSRTRFAERLGMTDSEQLCMLTLIGTEPSKARRTAIRRANALGLKIEDGAIGGRYRLPPEDIQARKEWALAIELAKAERSDASGEDLARWLKLTTGKTHTRQAATKARRMLAGLK